MLQMLPLFEVKAQGCADSCTARIEIALAEQPCEDQPIGEVWNEFWDGSLVGLASGSKNGAHVHNCMHTGKPAFIITVCMLLQAATDVRDYNNISILKNINMINNNLVHASRFMRDSTHGRGANQPDLLSACLPRGYATALSAFYGQNASQVAIWPLADSVSGNLRSAGCNGLLVPELQMEVVTQAPFCQGQDSWREQQLRREMVLLKLTAK